MLSDPTSRRPERRRALKATIRWSYELLFPDDQRGLWALATFAGGAPLPRRRVRPRSARRAGRRGDRRGRPAREPFAGDRRRRRRVDARPLPAARQHPRVRARSDDRRRADRARPRRARRMVRRRRRGPPPQGVRSSRQAEHLAFARAERANIDAALAWSADARPAARARASSTGSAGPGSSSATAEARNGSWPHSTRPATPPRPTTGPAPCCSRRGSKRRPVDLELARDHIAAATELADAIDDVDLQARCCYYLAYVVSHHGEFRTGDGADRSQPRRSTTGWTGRGTRPRTGSSPPEPRSRPVTSERSVEAATRSSTGCDMVDDPWLHVRRDAMLGELARLQHRFDDAVVHIGRAAETSRRLGFLQTEAYQVCQPRTSAVPGRRLRHRRRHPGARDRQGRGHR